jgi:hypothetical protein
MMSRLRTISDLDTGTRLDRLEESIKMIEARLERMYQNLVLDKETYPKLGGSDIYG